MTRALRHIPTTPSNLLVRRRGLLAGMGRAALALGEGAALGAAGDLGPSFGVSLLDASASAAVPARPDILTAKATDAAGNMSARGRDPRRCLDPWERLRA